jgi:hypothetical protein
MNAHTTQNSQQATNQPINRLTDQQANHAKIYRQNSAIKPNAAPHHQ